MCTVVFQGHCRDAPHSRPEQSSRALASMLNGTNSPKCSRVTADAPHSRPEQSSRALASVLNGINSPKCGDMQRALRTPKCSRVMLASSHPRARAHDGPVMHLEVQICVHASPMAIKPLSIWTGHNTPTRCRCCGSRHLSHSCSACRPGNADALSADGLVRRPRACGLCVRSPGPCKPVQI